MEQVELERRLAQSPLLAGVSLPAEQARVQSFPAGHILSDRPGGVPSVGLILSGRVEVYSVALDGKDVQLSTLPAGECFGVCNLLAGAELETVLRCGEETEVLYIPKPVLLACMERDAGLSLRYAELCNQKLQFLLRRIELLTMQSCRGRVIAHLLAGQDRNGCVKPTGSREDLARQLGVSRAANTQALWDEAERLNVTLVEDLHFRRDALSALDKVLAQADRVYLTIDLDVLPAGEMPAVSAPAALGVPALDLLPVIEHICRSGKLQAADLVEFNPQYDRDGQGAKLAARLAWQIAHWWA